MRLPPDVIAPARRRWCPPRQRTAACPRVAHQQWSTNFRIASVALTELHTSDLERYRAEPIEMPIFEDVEDADAFLDPREPVIAFSVGADARAYPLRLLVWHEVVNDVVDGQPLLVTYDPRTNAAQVFERRLLGSAMRFRAVDGLYRGGRLLWDSLTQSWWRQFTGEAIVGDYTGLRLQPRPSLLVSYAEFRRTFPQGRILGPASRPDRDEESEYGGHQLRRLRKQPGTAAVVRRRSRSPPAADRARAGAGAQRRGRGLRLQSPGQPARCERRSRRRADRGPVVAWRPLRAGYTQDCRRTRRRNGRRPRP